MQRESIAEYNPPIHYAFKIILKLPTASLLRDVKKCALNIPRHFDPSKITSSLPFVNIA